MAGLAFTQLQSLQTICFLNFLGVYALRGNQSLANFVTGVTMPLVSCHIDKGRCPSKKQRIRVIWGHLWMRFDPRWVVVRSATAEAMPSHPACLTWLRWIIHPQIHPFHAWRWLWTGCGQ